VPLVLGVNADGSSRVVRLDQVAQVVEATGSNQINRRDLTREVAITGNVSGRSAGEVSADIRAAMDGIAMPPGYGYKFSGSVKDMAEAFGYALSALVDGGDLHLHDSGQPVQEFFPAAGADDGAADDADRGGAGAMLMFNSTLSMFSVIGVVMLMGLVTKNAILLVDFAIRARSEHTERPGRYGGWTAGIDALLLAARVRLRPILMTTLAMIFGMMPLALCPV
jgi:HAE1 family hydrophobic/amphiphilic exporter-1